MQKNTQQSKNCTRRQLPGFILSSLTAKKGKMNSQLGKKPGCRQAAVKEWGDREKQTTLNQRDVSRTWFNSLPAGGTCSGAFLKNAFREIRGENYHLTQKKNNPHR